MNDAAKASSAKTPDPVARAGREISALLKTHPDITYVDAVLADLCGTLRGKRLPAAEAGKLVTSGMQITQSLYLMDVRGEMADPLGRGFGDGDPDGTAWPIPGTACAVWGSSPPRAQVLMTLHDGSGNVFAAEPRAVLERVLARFAAKGLTPVVALEFEFYLIDKTRGDGGAPQPPICPARGRREGVASVYGMSELDRFQPFFSALDEAAKTQNVPVSAVSKEYAPGQFEANLKHQDNALRAADHGVMLKQIVKAAANAVGFDATFMAKPYSDRAGSGLHVHLSLVDGKGRNIFNDGSDQGAPELRQAAGGLAELMPESMAVFAPNLNSYRRFAPNMFAPVNRRLGVNNRSAGLRVPFGPPEARRIEHRVAGADANPYLVLAAVLAGAHYGLEKKLDPGTLAEGNVSKMRDPALPQTLDAALALLDGKTVLSDYLGDETLALYRETKRVETERFRRIYSPAEYEWYL